MNRLFKWSLALGLACSPVAFSQEAAPAQPAADPIAEAPAEQADAAEALSFGELPEDFGYLSPKDEAAESIWQSIIGGKVDLNLRFRFEYGDQEGLRSSQAWTVRERIGYGTKPWNGLSFYGSVQDTRSVNDDLYNAAGLSGQPDRTVIADPEDTRIDQLKVVYAPPIWDSAFVIGRQAIIFDDHRWVGNVGWRQLQQTYDAAVFKSDFGVEGLEFIYGYLWNINRIFGPDADRDLESSSHAIHVSCADTGIGKLAAFAYLLDVPDAPTASSNTYGARLTNKYTLNEEQGLALDYIASYARQTDNADNPVSYDADYLAFEAAIAQESFGRIGGGYELLGSDDGIAAVQTPLATGHKFNGFADSFLATPATGLQDAYIVAGTDLPMGIKATVWYHWFWDHENGVNLGQEFDAVLLKKITRNWSVLFKYARFEGREAYSNVDRLILQTEFKF